MVLELDSSPSVETQSTPLTPEALIAIGTTLQDLDKRKKQLDLSGAGRGQTNDILREKDAMIDERLLPARHSRLLPPGYSVKVGLLIDERGREWKNLVEIRILTPDGRIFETRALTPENRTDGKGKQIKDLIGDYDYRLPRSTDNATRYPSLPRKGQFLKRPSR